MAAETFDIMWELSAPGSQAEGCFKRLTGRDYYAKKEACAAPAEALKGMPDVSRVAIINFMHC